MSILSLVLLNVLIVCFLLSFKVFTWGHGNTGALGHGTTEDEPTPRPVSAFGQEAAVEAAVVADAEAAAAGMPLPSDSEKVG